MISRMSLIIGHLLSTTRSNLRETLCFLRGHIFSLILVKLDQNVFLGIIFEEFENLAHLVRSLKNLEYVLEATFFVQYSMKLGQNNYHDDFLDQFESGSFQVIN